MHEGRQALAAGHTTDRMGEGSTYEPAGWQSLQQWPSWWCHHHHHQNQPGRTVNVCAAIDPKSTTVGFAYAMDTLPFSLRNGNG